MFRAKPANRALKHGAGTALVLASLCASTARADERDQFFESKIRPVLVGTCFACHGGGKTSAGLRVDSRAALLQGGDTGPALVAGMPEGSLLLAAIRRAEDASAMPPQAEEALRPDQVADFERWIADGAPWPEKSAAFAAEHPWSFEPRQAPPPPEVADTAWLQTSIDAFIRARQEAAGVKPAPPADKRTLIRRATYDLTGLPPTAAEVEAFLADDSPQAFDTVIERLLASPAYGERWARHWLDVVRYADTAGETADFPVPEAWRYRNYVIDAFNADTPYDEFLREQLAGDVLAAEGPADRYATRVTATGFLAISRRFGFDSENYHHLTIQDSIDTLGQAVLGLSLGCARCHDHKFDPVTMRDYYALYGIFASSRYAFPGSEQKQKTRSLAPLVPFEQAAPLWQAQESRIAELTALLARANQSPPSATLRSLGELDGDFETQAVAAGGSNGVLVPPWVYAGPIAVTNAAQSPYKNLYPLGKVGASIAASEAPYRITQAIDPHHHAPGSVLYFNLDYRVGASEPQAPGGHRVVLGTLAGQTTVEVQLAAGGATLLVPGGESRQAALPADRWHNLQIVVDLSRRTAAARVGAPGDVTELASIALGAVELPVIDCVTFESNGSAPGGYPAITYDNFGMRTAALEPVTTELPAASAAAGKPDAREIERRLGELAGYDGDFELQTDASPPATPWGPGPNSVVLVSAEAQSPFTNRYPAGSLGIHLPNRQAYDGFGLALANLKPDDAGQLAASFDFCCASAADGGDGSWRYYLGHGPGNSAAVELFFNGREFFRRSGATTDAVATLAIGAWYQVRLVLDLRTRTYRGELESADGTTEFSGELASGWDGTVDYSFIDSYGHLPGVRPALDADNFVFGRLPDVQSTEPSQRREQVAALRAERNELNHAADEAKQELDRLLSNGPCPLAYAMAEGTPQNVPIQQRGEPDQPGAVVPRGFIRSLGGGDLPEGTLGSGRLELAQWLTRPDHPLTARVMVNRIWQHHFGHGLVATPNDFGTRGQRPTHPELLDHLAEQFIASGWSIKAMHRLILRSATYQQSSIAGADVPHDPATANAYAAFSRRRLSAEEIRDTILALCGQLDRARGEGHEFPLPVRFGYTQHNPFAAVYDHRHRSIYLMVQRIKRHPFLALFDGADPNATTPTRLLTTVPTQALYFLNDPFVHENSEHWAKELAAQAANPAQAVELAYHQALGRGPAEGEQREAADFLTAYRAELATTEVTEPETRALAAFLRTLLASNEVLYVD
ncbi:MAG: PSD1 and planctomycete cytochrome C domain-containing protein [Pirellulales bacterium]|nr:PSD1 and planctomycete cytochrome C domain-containing protein [Pirellulales bacterium]